MLLAATPIDVPQRVGPTCAKIAPNVSPTPSIHPPPLACPSCCAGTNGQLDRRLRANTQFGIAKNLTVLNLGHAVSGRCGVPIEGRSSQPSAPIFLAYWLHVSLSTNHTASYPKCPLLTTFDRFPVANCRSRLSLTPLWATRPPWPSATTLSTACTSCATPTGCVMLWALHQVFPAHSKRFWLVGVGKPTALHRVAGRLLASRRSTVGAACNCWPVQSVAFSALRPVCKTANRVATFQPASHPPTPPHSCRSAAS